MNLKVKVLDFVKSGGPTRTELRTFRWEVSLRGDNSLKPGNFECMFIESIYFAGFPASGTGEIEPIT